MTDRQRTGWIIGSVSAVVLLCGPVAVWLQAREWHVRPAVRPDVVYVVAGARGQDLRVQAAGRYLQRTAHQPVVLVGNDRTRGGWATAAQRNLTMGEWAVVKLRRSFGVNASLNELRIDIVPGEFDGTDGEMQALAAYLARNPAIRQVAVVTSAFHVRRTVSRLRRHIGGVCSVSAVSVAPRLEDYLPWVVLGEAMKLGRDSVGLAHAPFISRTARFDERDGWIVAAFLALAYAWVLYPALIGVVGRRRPGPAATGAAREPDGVPHVSVLIAAHNEEPHIGARIRNLTDGHWPSEAIDIWIGSDGSTDRTVEAAREAGSGNPRVHVVAYADRRGKTAVLKDLAVASAEGMSEGERKADILLFTDANTFFAPNAVRALVESFADAGVGGACGRLVFTQQTEDPKSAGRGEEKRGREETGYWDWENRMKRGESRLDSCLGANGAIYALRRDLFWDAIPANTIVDDFVIGMKVREQGKRMVYVEGAVAREPLPPSDSDEWRRRVRIGAGVFQALALCRHCLLLRYGRFAWMFWSHKVLRWFTPHLLILLIVMSWFVLIARVVEGGGWSVGLVVGGVAQALLLAAPVGILAAKWRGRAAGALRLAWYFVYIQAAMLVGFLRFCRGGLSGAWERTRR